MLLAALCLTACPPGESHVGEGGHGSTTQGEGSAAPGGAGGGDAGP